MPVQHAYKTALIEKTSFWFKLTFFWVEIQCCKKAAFEKISIFVQTNIKNKKPLM